MIPDVTKLDEEAQIDSMELSVDAEKDCFPFCLVWTPIPVLTWVLPMLGHLGVADSHGVTYDFAGPYFVGEGHMAFGRTTRYIQLKPSCGARSWDDAVQEANCVYRQRMHNLCCQNCHSHVATVLDKVQYGSFKRWNMFILALWMFFAGRFVSKGAFLYSVMPSLIVYGIVLAVVISY